MFLNSAGHIQTSESFLLKAREYSLPEFNIEKAKHMRSEVSVLYMKCFFLIKNILNRVQHMLL